MDALSAMTDMMIMVGGIITTIRIIPMRIIIEGQFPPSGCADGEGNAAGLSIMELRKPNLRIGVD
jgi:hypothetical protein